MSIKKYVSIDRIFSKLIRDVTNEFNEGDVIEWCGEALEFIQAVRSVEEAVAFVEVKNHQCEVPAGTHSITQIARNNRWRGPVPDSICPLEVITSACCNTKPAPQDDKPSIPVILDCNGEPITDYELAYYRPFFNLRLEYFGWCNSSLYSHYSPVRLATNTFFESLALVNVEKDQNRIYRASTDEYKIIKGEILRFSFKEGSVAIAYDRQILDDSGYPMIPDHVSYTTAIIKYITMMMLNKQCIAGREGVCSKADKADRDWQWYCKQAGNLEMMVNGVDEHQNMLDQRSYILPRQNRYYGFFGKMARPESRRYNDPDNRNWNNYFRGTAIR